MAPTKNIDCETEAQDRMRSACESLLALVLLVVASPLLGVLGVIIKATSKGPVVFTQERVGRGHRLFTIYKLRTMVERAEIVGAKITSEDDERITGVGRFLRRTKLDELPQFWNVVKGDMAFVGPRPEVPEFVRRFSDDYHEILRVRPGLTDLASLKYVSEATVLARSESPEEDYVNTILPDKIALAKEYLRQRSLWLDLKIVLGTVARIASVPLEASRRR